MNLLNHNIRMNNELYHVQTEVINKNTKHILSSLIYKAGEIIWCKELEEKNSIDKSDLKKKAENLHKKAIIYLRDTLHPREKKRNALTEEVIEQIKKTSCRITGFISLYISKNNYEIYNHSSKGIDINHKNLKVHTNKMRKLLERVAEKTTFRGFNSLTLETEKSLVLSVHHQEYNINMFLLLEKSSSIPMSKIILDKVIHLIVD